MDKLRGRHIWFVLAIAVGNSIVAAQPAAERPIWKPRFRIYGDVLVEMSGVVESRAYPGVYWIHGDSGTDPRLVAIDTNGEVLAEVKIAGAPNTDWEDICTDDAGHLYIGDIGNSKEMFPARYIYKIAEPDPHNPPSNAVQVLERLRFKYPGKERFNIESLFWRAGSLYVIPRTVGPIAIYRVEPIGDHEARLVEVAVLRGPSATGADVSSDGKRLLVCSPYCVTVYPLTDDDSFVDAAGAKRVTYPAEGGVEACCFTESGVVVGREDGAVYVISAEQIEQQVRFADP